MVFSEVLVLPKMQIPIPLFTFHPFLFVAMFMHVLYSFMSLVNSLLQLPQYLSAANDTLSGLASLRRHFRSSSRRRIGRPAGVRGVGRTTVSVPASVSARSVFVLLARGVASCAVRVGSLAPFAGEDAPRVVLPPEVDAPIFNVDE